MTDRRRRREAPVETLPEPATSCVDEAEVADLVAVLDEEIARLPEHQRVPIVVCELEGRSRREAAGQLGISEGTLSSRLARARRALAGRLRQRGIVLSAAGLTAAFAQLASGGVPSDLAAKAVAGAIGPGHVPATVAALSHGALRVMFIQKLKVLTLTLVLAFGLLASALSVGGQLVADPPAGATPPTTVPVSAEPPSPNPDQPAPKPAAGKPLPQGPNKILIWRSGTIVLIDPDGKNEKKVAEDRKQHYDEARLSPDGKKIAVLVKSGAHVHGAPGEAQPQKLYVRGLDEKEPGTDLGVECWTFFWSPDGSEIVCCDFTNTPDKTREATHFVVDVKTKEKKPLKIPGDHLLTDWSWDGKYFLTTRVVADKEKPRARLYLMNRDGTEHKALTDEKQLSVFGRLSPDGKRVLYLIMTPPKEGKGQPKQELAVLDIPTGKSAVVGDTPLNGEFLGYCWSPDGKRIAYTWRQVHDGKPEDLQTKETESFLVVCDPDGKNQKTIASEKAQGQSILTLWRVDWR